MRNYQNKMRRFADLSSIGRRAWPLLHTPFCAFLFRKFWPNTCHLRCRNRSQMRTTQERISYWVFDFLICQNWEMRVPANFFFRQSTFCFLRTVFRTVCKPFYLLLLPCCLPPLSVVMGDFVSMVLYPSMFCLLLYFSIHLLFFDFVLLKVFWQIHLDKTT